MTKSTTFAFLCALLIASAAAFSTPTTQTTGRSATMLSALSNNNNDSADDQTLLSRRKALFGMAAAAFAAPQAANAKYSDYSRREKDWQERKENGEVQYSSARDLKAQLAQIAPMNTESSRIFCPNGPSAAVSPLMENKCGDRLATPSVFGRQDDIVGNSIPGFSSGKGYLPDEGTTTIASMSGGFPSYKTNEYSIKMR